ncbi:hypothetical protein BC833DRAFT_605803 [Globomyces pollinis-pini]|nr:hypothetical protein BC833DRAFT_605803 [Globomyces pollinis-pini]KAJ2992660.1 hypothetical protein HDV02_002945 [Globomyces sp. JEL0801]
MYTNEPQLSTRDASFISLVTYRILYDQNMTSPLVQVIHDSKSVISPKGAEDWFPKFADSVHELLSQSQLNLPIIVIALIYLARIRNQINKFPGLEFSFFLAACMISHKMFTDSQFSSQVWAEISDHSTDEVKEIERQFIRLIDGKLHVRNDQYQQFIGVLQALGKNHISIL